MSYIKLQALLTNKKGFSLIEMMIFVVILSMVFVIAISYVVNLMRTMKINEHKIIATYYAEELREWLKSEKEADWDGFSQKAGFDDGAVGGNDPITYCFNNDIAINETVSSMGNSAKFPNQACTTYSGITGRPPMLFKRQVTLTKNSLNSPNSVEANIEVSWIEAGSEYKVPINARYTVWE